MRTSSVFGRGGWLDAATVSAKLALLVTVGSVVVHLWAAAAQVLLLQPGEVIGGLKLWQLVTYGVALPLTQPFAFIISLLMLWSIGGRMELGWSTPRYLWFLGGILVSSAVLTVLMGLVWPMVRMIPFYGAEVLTLAVWAGYGFSLGSRQTGFWGLPLSGNGLALIGLGFVALNAVIARTAAVVVPELFSFGLTYLYVRYGSPKVVLLRLKQWKLQRDLKSRAKKLNVLSGGRQDRGSDKYIH